MKSYSEIFRKSLESRLIYLFLLYPFLALIAGLYSLQPLEDYDFFWHIATGRWIVEHHAIPYTDPFSFTTSSTSSHVHFVLSGYWLSQVLYYAMYYIFGWNGIILLRFLIMLALIYSLFKLGTPRDKVIHVLLVFLAGFVILKLYPVERPQAFSFFFFSMFLYHLESSVS